MCATNDTRSFDTRVCGLSDEGDAFVGCSKFLAHKISFLTVTRLLCLIITEPEYGLGHPTTL